MTAEHSSTPGGAPSRARLVFVVALALVVAVVVAAVIVARGRQSAAADCEKAPPKVEFAVAECEAGTPAQGAAPASGTPAAPKP